MDNLQNDSFDLWQYLKGQFKEDSLIRHLPFLLFIAVLGVFYIANAHYHLQLERKIDEQEAINKRLEWEYLTVKSDVMLKSKQSEVAKAVLSMGLKPLVAPPKLIEVKK